MYLTSIFSILFCSWLSVSSLTDRGSITSTGMPWPTRIAGGNCGVSVSGSAVSLSQSCAPRVYLMKDSYNFAKFPNLLGKTVKFTANLASAPCGCNAAVYFIQVPSTVNGGDYYCDAQCPNGNCCPEIDIFEANTHAFQATAHCGGGDNPCKWGCGINWKSGNGYGVGGYTINTASDFNCEMSFVSSSGTLSAIHVKLSQGTRSMSYSITNSVCSLKSNYIGGLTSAVTSGQLVMAISYWGGDMNWLDGCSSGGSCPSSTITFKNFQLINGITAIEGDATANSAFISTPGFYALIGVCVLVALLAVVAAVVIVKKRSYHEAV